MKDNKKVTIKSLVMTVNRLNTSKKKALREALSSNVKKIAEKLSKKELLLSSAQGILQGKTKRILNKIAPVKRVEVKKIQF